MNQLPTGAVDGTLASALTSAAEATREALSRLFSCEVRLTRSTPLSDQPLPPSPGVQVAFDIHGPVDAKVLVSAEGPDATRLADALLKRSPSASLDVAGREALAEMANIVASTFLSRLASFGRLRLLPSVPAVRELTPARPTDTVAVEYEVVWADRRATFRLHTVPEGPFREAIQTALAAAS